MNSLTHFRSTLFSRFPHLSRPLRHCLPQQGKYPLTVPKRRHKSRSGANCSSRRQFLPPLLQPRPLPCPLQSRKNRKPTSSSRSPKPVTLRLSFSQPNPSVTKTYSLLPMPSLRSVQNRTATWRNSLAASEVPRIQSHRCRRPCLLHHANPSHQVQR